MVRIFRWGSLLVLLAALLTAGLTYPDLRARILAPVAATPTPSPMSIVLPLPTPTTSVEAVVQGIEVSAADMNVDMNVDEQVKVEAAHPPLPAVVIVPPGTTQLLPTPAPDQSAPVAVYATTSLLPAGQVADPAAQPAGGFVPTPRPALTEASTAAPHPTATLTPIPVSFPTDPLVASQVITTDAAISQPTPHQSAAQPPVTSTVAISVPVDLTPTGPYARVDAPLYAGPGPDFPLVGSVAAGQPVDILGWYTEGTWFLLTNGLWLEAAQVGNPPAALPLVFPTPTFTPSPTPTITPTPTPTDTPVAPPSPTPTPTSLDAPICNCTADQYDCLGSVFPNRAAAQLCLEYCYRQTGWDVHNLDPNGNGLACENLP